MGREAKAREARIPDGSGLRTDARTGPVQRALRLIRSAVQRTSRLPRFRLKLVCRGCRLVRRLGELRDNAVMRCLLVGEGEAEKFGLTPHRADKDEAEWRSAADPPCRNGDARKTCNVDL